MDFESHRPLLFSIAYRMLGSVADAEDMVQETYLRLGDAQRGGIENPRAYLCAIVTHLCIDYLRSARKRREVRTGVTLPEPIGRSLNAAPTDTAALAESLSIAFLTMLQSLAPVERAAFILHEVFDFDYREVGKIIGKSPVNCRQIVNRARRSLSGGRSRFAVDSREVREIVERFVRVAQSGDLTSLLELLAPDVTLYADGGVHGARYGAVRSLRRPLTGSRAVARFILAGQAHAADTVRFEIRDLNFSPAILSYVGEQPLGAISFDVVEHRIQNIFILADPEKLHFLKPQDA